MAEQGALRRTGLLRIARELDPFRATWRLFTNVRWAIGIIAFLALASLLGVVLPQTPANVRGDPAAEARWLAEQEGRFGFLTDVLDRLGLFDVFHAGWFVYALGLLVVSVTVCTASRLPPIWRAVTRPRKRVSDSYFGTARHRFEYETPAGGSRLADVLRRRRYAVTTFREADTTFLFGDRFQFAQLATFVSHLALIVILAAALVSWFTGFSTDVMVAEGSTAPVFPLTHSDRMQVEVVDAVGRFSEDQPLEYRSDIAVHRDGKRVKVCTSTVNSPCSYDGYRFLMAAYFGFGADVQVRDLESGNVVFRETMRLSDTLPSPHVVVRDARGQTLLDDTLVLTEMLSSEEFTYYGRLVELPGGRPLTVGARSDADGADWELAVFEPAAGEDAARLVLSQGETGRAGGLEVTYADLQAVPAGWARDFPLPGADAGGSGRADVLMQMSNVVYGTDTPSEGTSVEAVGGSGPAKLTLVGLQPSAVTLEAGESAGLGGYEYTFLGQREFSGIEVKKDRSDWLVWSGAAMLVGGLLVTFWVPRRRIWAKITPARTYLAGQAGHLVRLEQEMADLARNAGAELKQEEGRESDG